MKLFRKAMLAVITMVLAVVAIVVPANRTTEVEAATIPAGTNLYLKPGTNWKQSNARFAAYFFGNGDAWVSMTLVEGETDIYKVTSPAKSFTNVIFCRMNPSTTANNWNEGTKWNQTSDLTYDGSNNLYTVANSAWDKGSGSWSTYTEKAPEVPLKDFTVNYYVEGDLFKTTTVKENSYLNLDIDKPTKEGYLFDAWCKDSTLSTYAESIQVTANVNLYAKFVEPRTIYLDAGLWDADDAIFWVHSWDVDSMDVLMEKTEIDGIYKVEIKPSHTSILFVRAKPESTAGDWDSKWNQSPDIAIPADSNLCVLSGMGDEVTGSWTNYTEPEITASIGWQTGVKGESTALRIVVAFTGLTAEIATKYSNEIQISVSYNGQPYVHTVKALFTGVASLGEGEVPAADLYAVLTIEGIPSGEFAIEALIGGEVVATATANA